MKIAMIITGVAAMILTVIGCVPYVRAYKNEDAEKMIKAKRWFSVASLFLTGFVILLVVLVVRMLLSFL